MMASQVGDNNGEQHIGADYIANLKSPLSDEDIRAVSQFHAKHKRSRV